MKTTRNRSLATGNWRATPSLEDSFWRALKDIAKRQDRSVANIVREIDRKRKPLEQLALSIRVYVLQETIAQVQEGKQHANELRAAIDQLILGADETANDVTDGLAPVPVVIAGARNAA